MENMVNSEFLSKYFSGKKVFLTGHTGFKGSWLSIWLKMAGANVLGYALNPDDERSLFSLTNPLVGVESVIADIRDFETLQDQVAKFAPDFVFHLAAQPLVRLSYKQPKDTFDVNVMGTVNLLEAVRGLQKKCTVVVITTDKVYENKETGKHYLEDDKLGGYDPYSASKACAEIVADSYRKSFFYANVESPQGRVRLATARAGNVIGGGDYSKDRIIPDVVTALERGEEIVVRNPKSVRPWQHVLEPLSGYLLLAAKLSEDEAFAEAFNFGPEPEDHLTVEQLVETAIAMWGKGSWASPKLENQPHEAGLLQLDISKSKERLGWLPKMSAKDAIRLTLDWYLAYSKANMLELCKRQINQFMES